MNLLCDLQLNIRLFEIQEIQTEQIVFREVLVVEVQLLLLEIYV
jgi:hypothetical protein